MNGLKLIRTQCNYTSVELAEKLSVTKQAISAWETGKKVIPTERKAEIAHLFGVDETHLGELSDEDIAKLVRCPKFRKMEGDKEYFTYSDTNKMGADEKTLKYRYEGVRDLTLSDELAQRREAQAALEAEIHKSFECRTSNKNLENQMLYINRGIGLYSRFVEIIDMFYSQSPINKMTYFKTIMEALDGMRVAMGKEVDPEEYGGDRTVIDVFANSFMEQYSVNDKHASIPQEEHTKHLKEGKLKILGIRSDKPLDFENDEEAKAMMQQMLGRVDKDNSK